MAFFNFSTLTYVLLLAVPSLCSNHHLDTLSHHSLHRHNARHTHNIRRDVGILVQRQEDTPIVEKPALLANASQSDLEKARQVVKAAIQQATQHNKARLDNPARNNYSLKPGTSTPLVRKDVNTGDNSTAVDEVAPLFNVTNEIASAAALLAEAEAYKEIVSNATLARRHLERRAKRPSKWWLGIIDHRSATGGWPLGKNAATFTVFRDVTDTKYGAKGDGITDDTEAIRKAVADGEMCGPACYSSTTKGAIIYFPPGTYLVSGTIETYFGTQFIGDAVERPTIKASGSFVGLGVISTDKYVGGYMPDGTDKEWFINTANFYRQIRNLNIDIQSTDPGAYVCAIHYQVGQATSIQYLKLIAKSGTTQQGIFTENGSGGFIGDIEFVGGNFGIYGGNQQFTAQRLTFTGYKTAIQIIWDWSWTWKTIKIKDATTGFRLLSETGQRNTGSILVVDSWFENVGTAILTFPAKVVKGDGTTGLTLDNVKFTNTNQGVADTDGLSYLSAAQDVDTWVLGRIYVNQQKQTAIHTPFKTPRDTAMTGPNTWGLPKAPFYEKSKPQYETESASNFRHVQSSCAGDGGKIVTSCVQSFIDQYANSGIIYFDAGSYMLDNTITIPPGARIVGEAWSQLVAVGTAFQDEKSPKPLIKVGNEGSVGKVEMQDLIFTSKGPTAGVVFVEWNIRADAPGSAGMWDCHVRVGGAVGTDLTVNECPAGSVNAKCKAGAALMHMTSESSGYLENVWLWVADHDIDDPDLVNDANIMLQCSIFVARGLLVESKRPTWLYSTAAEHAVFYQYEFYRAENVYAAMIQTESPYYQPTPNPPALFQAGVKAMPGDPAYACGSGETCDSSWALRILESKNILIHGAGLYSWFDTYTQTCLQTISCQKSLIEFKNNGVGIRIHNLITIGAKNMIEADNGVVITAVDNQAVDFHPRWSQISVFEPYQFINHCTGLPDNTNPSNIPQGEMFAIKPEDDGMVAYFTIVNG